jgi:lactate racemase
MRYSFPYEFAEEINIPDKNFLGVFQVKSEKPSNESEIIQKAIANPIRAPRIKDFIKPDEKILILPDDVTRKTPADRILPFLIHELEEIGVPDENVHFLMSLGTHRKMTQDELEKKLGGEIVNRFVVSNHHWEELDNLHYIDTSSQGVPIYINKEALKADHIIGVGCIFPHAVAGYSGGGKIVIPGITGEATCGDMHWAMYGIPPKQLYGVARNPVREIINEFSIKAGLDYVLDAILDNDGGVLGMVVGDPIEAHYAGCDIARDHYGVTVPGPADIVIFDSYGSDIEYWQAIKAITPAGIVMKDNGIVIQVAACPEGVSVSHPEVLEFGYRPLIVVEDMMKQGLVNKSVAAHMIQASEVIVDRGRGFLISPGISKQDISRLGFLTADNPQDALDRALAIKGENASIIVLRAAGDLLPIF